MSTSSSSIRQVVVEEVGEQQVPAEDVLLLLLVLVACGYWSLNHDTIRKSSKGLGTSLGLQMLHLSVS